MITEEKFLCYHCDRVYNGAVGHNLLERGSEIVLRLSLLEVLIIIAYGSMGLQRMSSSLLGMLLVTVLVFSSEQSVVLTMLLPRSRKSF